MIQSTAANVFEYEDSTVTAGIAYDYFISANNSLFGEGTRSSGLVQILALSPPSEVGAPALVRSSQSSLFMIWSPANNTGGAVASLVYALEIKESTAGS